MGPTSKLSQLPAVHRAATSNEDTVTHPRARHDRTRNSHLSTCTCGISEAHDEWLRISAASPLTVTQPSPWNLTRSHAAAIASGSSTGHSSIKQILSLSHSSWIGTRHASRTSSVMNGLDVVVEAPLSDEVQHLVCQRGFRPRRRSDAAAASRPT